MDVVLVGVTALALLVAGAMALIAWRMVREDRERSQARVAALAADIDAAIDAPQTARPIEPADAPAAAARAAAGQPGSEVNLFSTAGDERSALARLGPAVLAGVVLVGGVLGTVLLFSSGNDAASAAASHQARPLELLSLRHSSQGGTLNVTGLVRNPAGNAPTERLTAVVFLFDDKGGFLTSGRAPLDFSSLAPGEESPFVVAVGAPGGAARYRISFRRDEGGVVPHVDRREGR